MLRKSIFAALLAGIALAGCGGSSISNPLQGSTEVKIISPTGSDVVAKSGRVRLVVPAGAISSAIAMGVTNQPTAPQTVDFVKNTAYLLEPTDTAFDSDATLTISYVPADMPAGSVEADLVLAKLNGGTWTPVAGSTVDEANNRVSGNIDILGTYGVVVND